MCWVCESTHLLLVPLNVIPIGCCDGRGSNLFFAPVYLANAKPERAAVRNLLAEWRRDASPGSAVVISARAFQNCPSLGRTVILQHSSAYSSKITVNRE